MKLYCIKKKQKELHLNSRMNGKVQFEFRPVQLVVRIHELRTSKIL